MTTQRPDGTVYGRGGVDVREPRHGLHPVVLGLVIVAAITATLALGYWAVLRGPADPPPPADQAGAQAPAAQAAAPAPAPSSAPAASPSRSPSPSPAPTFGTGQVLLSPAGDRDTYLRAEGDAAALASGASVLTVTKGLADSSCFTLRDGRGRYLRHFDFRLRFDAPEDSDLFRQDATFCLADQRAGVVRLRSKNYPDRLVHRRGAQLAIDRPDGSGAFTKDSSFAVRRP